jgi:hypothetical protein
MAASLRLAFLVLASAASLAQAAPPRPAPGMGAVSVDGVVQRYLTTPYGQLNGLRLRDGRLVLFGPPMAPDVVTAAPLGARVRVTGQEAQDGALRAIRLVNAATGESADDTPIHTPNHTPNHPPHPAVHAPLVQCEAAGIVDVVLHGPRGDANGVILVDGAVIYFRPDLVQSEPIPGQAFAAIGIGAAGQRSMALEAIVVGANLSGVRAAGAAAPIVNRPIPPLPFQEPPRNAD